MRVTCADSTLPDDLPGTVRHRSNRHWGRIERECSDRQAHDEQAATAVQQVANVIELRPVPIKNGYRDQREKAIEGVVFRRLAFELL